MHRIMGDATHDAALAIPSWVDLIAGYVTGSPDIRWTDADWQHWAGKQLVRIDQGFTGAPVYSANVQDVETGAYTPGSVPSWQGQCTAPRPTVYCSQNPLPAILSTGWRGDLWLAIPGWSLGQPLPSAPGCTIVAVQNVFTTGYDTSIVLDPAWPLRGGGMPISAQPGWRWCVKCSSLFYSATSKGNVCPAGGQHDGTQSLDYSQLNDGTVPGI